MTCGSYYGNHRYGYRLDFLYDFCPGYAGNIAFLVIFGLIFLAQVIQGIFWRQWWFFFWWLIGCGLYAGIFGARVAKYYTDNLAMASSADLALTYLAPAFHVVGIYYLLSKLVTVYGHRYSPLSPRTIWFSFTAAGIAAIAVLAGGLGYFLNHRGSRSINSYSYYYNSGSNYGGWIILAGLLVQFITMTVFLVFLSIFTHRVRTDRTRSYNQDWHHVRARPLFRGLLPAVFLSFLFIYGRTIAKIVTLFTGWGEDYLTIGALSLVFDTIFMALATLILTVIYPGVCFGRGRIPVLGNSQQSAVATNEPFSVQSAHYKTSEADVYYSPDPRAM